jgi:hypothetical protein
MALKRDFRKWAKDHPNFITPNIVELIEKDNIIIEVSEGSRMGGEGEMYGVSVAKKTPQGWKMQEGGKAFYNSDDAFAYARSIKKHKLKDVS